MHIRPPRTCYSRQEIIVHEQECIHRNARQNLMNVRCNCSDTLNHVFEQLYLGVIIDCDFSWAPHITKVCSRLRSSLFGLYNLAKVVEPKVSIVVYKSLVESVINFALPAWGSATTSYLERISRLQQAALRIIHKKPLVSPVQDKVPTGGTRAQRSNAQYKRYVVPIKRNSYGDRELEVVVPSIFNSLPEELIALPSYAIAKQKTKAWLLESV